MAFVTSPSSAADQNKSFFAGLWLTGTSLTGASLTATWLGEDIDVL
jgi:hypothetical protein